MKKFILLLFIVLDQLQAQNYRELELNTSIEEVTVYLHGAQVLRTGKEQIPAGKSLLKINSISPYIDAKTVRVEAEGDFKIISVNYNQNYLNRLKKDHRIDSLATIKTFLELHISQKESRLEVLKEMQGLLNENKFLGSQSYAPTLDQIKQAMNFFKDELTAIKSEEIDIGEEIKDLKQQVENIGREIAEVRSEQDLPSGEIRIRVESERNTQGDFKISYKVANAGWYPKYDIRVTSVEEPLELRYKADIYQNTGVEWEQVKLRLSNADPNQSGVAPELETWYLNYARNTVFTRPDLLGPSASGKVYGKIVDETGEPLPGVNIVIKGTTIGTVTDIDGNYSLTLPNGATHIVASYIGYQTEELPISGQFVNAQLSSDVTALEEVVVTGYALQGRISGVSIRGNNSIPRAKAQTITTTTIENQTTVEFEIDQPYSVKSNGEMLSVDLRSLNIETLYQYYAVPKLDQDAFLVASMINWGQYNLLEGEVNLYFEDAYVGRSILDARSLEDTLDISLGRDKSIVIGRQKEDEYSKRQTIGGNKVDSRAFEIIARNKKSQAINITLIDQIPVAAINAINVKVDELSAGSLEEETGLITWELTLEPQQQQELSLAYEVKYPKYEKVIIE